MSSKKEDSADMSTETFLDLILVKTERKANKQHHDYQQPHQSQEARPELSPPSPPSPPASSSPPQSPPQQQQQQQQIIALHLGRIVREQSEQPPSSPVRLGEQREKEAGGCEMLAYACAQCGTECKNEQGLAEHVRVEHKAHKCPLCNKIFAHKYMMEKHVYVHSDKREHGCSQCAMSFKRECDLLSHVKRRHATKSKTTTYGCDKCEFSCGSRFGIKIHSLAHDGLFAYNCDECGKGFNSKMDLRTHKNNHIGFKPFQCDVCGNKFTRGTYLKQHRRTMHENPRSFECAICGRRFSLKSTIKNHLLRHTGENRNFTCDMCGRRVSSRNALINHQRIHTGDKRFACSICGKAYVTKLQVKRHAYLHTDSKPYECDVCGRHLATSSSLFKHLQTHWQHRLLYSCNVCSKTYVSKYKLRAHTINSHRTAFVNIDTVGDDGGLSSSSSCEQRTPSLTNLMLT